MTKQQIDAEEWFDGLNELLDIAPSVKELPPGRNTEVYRNTLVTLLTQRLAAAPQEIRDQFLARFPRR